MFKSRSSYIFSIVILLIIPGWSHTEEAPLYKAIVDNSRVFWEQEAFNDFHTAVNMYKINGLLPNRLEAIVGNDKTKQQKAVEFAKGVRPRIPDRVKNLMSDVLNLKKNGDIGCCCSNREREFYKDMSLCEFAVRLFAGRAYVFYNKNDQYLTCDHNGKKIAGNDDPGWKNTPGVYKATLVGTDSEIEGAHLETMLSYHEIEIAALCGLSSKNFCINDGGRMSKFKKNEYVEEVLIGAMVAPRLGEKKGFMEEKHMIVTQEQNTAEKGYGKDGNDELLKIWAKFYDEKYFWLYQEADENNPKKAVKTKNNDGSITYINGPDRFDMLMNENSLQLGYLDTQIYNKRLAISIEEQFIDACERMNNPYIHLCGLGLGAWLATPPHLKTRSYDNSSCKAQIIEILNVCDQLLDDERFAKIKAIDVSWFPEEPMQDLIGSRFIERLQGKHPNVDIMVSKRDIFAPLPENHKDKELFVIFPWDGGSYISNEFFLGSLKSTVDSDVGRSSTATELMNPEINPYLIPKIIKVMIDWMKLKGMSIDEQLKEVPSIIKKYAAHDAIENQMLECWYEISGGISVSPSKAKIVTARKTSSSSSSSSSSNEDAETVKQAKDKEKKKEVVVERIETTGKNNLDATKKDTTINPASSSLKNKLMCGLAFFGVAGFLAWLCYKNNGLPIPMLCAS